MKKRASLLLILLFLAPFFAGAAKPRKNAPGFPWRGVPNTAFGAGEKISFQVRFGIVPSGQASLEVKGIENVAGRPAFHVLSSARSTGAVNALHKIRENHESWIDEKSLCSLRFVENVHEGSYRKEATTTFDPPRGRSTHVYVTNKSSGTVAAKAPAYTQDSVSVIYFLRTRDLKPGAEYTVPTQSGGDVFTVKVRVKGVETIQVPAGRFECFHLQPVLAGKKKDQPKGQLEVWLTTDSRRIPVLLKTRLFIGSFDARLTEYSPPRP